MPESQVGPRVVNPMPAKVACEAALGMLMRGLGYPSYTQVITDADMDRSEKGKVANFPPDFCGACLSQR